MPACWETLGLSKATATEPEVRRVWRDLAARIHPDKGGTVEAFTLAHRAYEEALAYVRQGMRCPACDGSGKARAKVGGFAVQAGACSACKGKGVVK